MQATSKDFVILSFNIKVAQIWGFDNESLLSYTDAVQYLITSTLHNLISYKTLHYLKILIFLSGAFRGIWDYQTPASINMQLTKM